jgi:hypothetical protein
MFLRVAADPYAKLVGLHQVKNLQVLPNSLPQFAEPSFASIDTFPSKLVYHNCYHPLIAGHFQ